MASALHLVVRLVHVLGMAVLLGGAALAWDAFRGAGDHDASADAPDGTDADGNDADDDSEGAGESGSGALRLAGHYEWVFWAAMGLLVVTGVGNLGALGPPGPGTRWGTVLTAKLLVVTAFVLGSFLRTLAVVDLRARASTGPADGADGRRFCRRAYAATAWSLVAVVALAEVLAHG